MDSYEMLLTLRESLEFCSPSQKWLDQWHQDIVPSIHQPTWGLRNSRRCGHKRTEFQAGQAEGAGAYSDSDFIFNFPFLTIVWKTHGNLLQRYPVSIQAKEVISVKNKWIYKNVIKCKLTSTTEAHQKTGDRLPESPRDGGWIRVSEGEHT